MTFDIQQYRIPASISAGFFDFLLAVPRQGKKCGASRRKPYFLRFRGAKVSGAAHGVGAGKLSYGAAAGTDTEAERKAE